MVKTGISRRTLEVHNFKNQVSKMAYKILNFRRKNLNLACMALVRPCEQADIKKTPMCSVFRLFEPLESLKWSLIFWVKLPL